MSIRWMYKNKYLNMYSTTVTTTISGTTLYYYYLYIDLNIWKGRVR